MNEKFCVTVCYNLWYTFQYLKRYCYKILMLLHCERHLYVYIFQLTAYYGNIQQPWCTIHKVPAWQNLLYIVIQADERTMLSM